MKYPAIKLVSIIIDMNFFIIFIVLFFVSANIFAQTQQDAENFIITKLQKYTDPYGNEDDDEAKRDLVSYEIFFQNENLIIKSVSQSAPYVATIWQTINLRFFKNIAIGNCGNRRCISIRTDGSHCVYRAKDHYLNKDNEVKRQGYMLFYLKKNIDIESNIEARMSKALNDLKSFYSGNEKY